MKNIDLNKLKESFQGKKILITGHTGFKGSWLCAWLNTLGARVVGLSINIPTKPSNFEASGIGSIVEDYREDIRDPEAVKKIIKRSQ